MLYEVITIYGEQEPKHYGTLVPYSLGGEDPLDGISTYKSGTPVPHWHFVTYGFSELYEKELDNTEYSGYGFELTFRLVRNEDEEEPPAWALNVITSYSIHYTKLYDDRCCRFWRADRSAFAWYLWGGYCSREYHHRKVCRSIYDAYFNYRFDYACVITSYSIHYTKLYDSFAVTAEGEVWAWGQGYSAICVRFP